MSIQDDIKLLREIGSADEVNDADVAALKRVLVTLEGAQEALRYVVHSGDKDGNWSNNWTELYLKVREALVGKK